MKEDLVMKEMMIQCADTATARMVAKTRMTLQKRTPQRVDPACLMSTIQIDRGPSHKADLLSKASLALVGREEIFSE